ncbi:hypothetical protein SASPL_139450 [Salvia splendens]|uniref:Uncharacterized protein n=1 Tax=Salvia splendens TaxID=180675 RepID=A0A8X8WP10_SALSN|nr:hypothetical protein SASPL_139450 [Salvia splendens]
MEVLLILVVIAAIIWLCKIRNWWNFNSTTKSSQIPLGSFGIFPFVGETIHFISSAYSDRPESFVDKRRRTYGKVFKSHLFGSPTIVSSDAEVSKIILQSDARTFIPSYPKSLMELMGRSSILVINGSLQRRIHGLIGSFFKTSTLKSQITAEMERYVMESMGRWREDSPIYIQDEAKNAKRKMVKIIDGIIQEKRGCNEGITKDVVDALLNDKNEQVTDELIAENMVDLMIPGEDSVPLLMSLAIKYLSDCPAALTQLIEENIKLKKHKEKLKEPFSWNDYVSSLPFTQTVITETLRMGNIITGVMRKAMKDVEIKGYLIPKGWCVFAYFRSVHLDDKLYDFPYQFNPWRWQDKEINNGNFTPFGGGQRLCPGLDLARLETSIFLHHFVTQFRWEVEDDSIVNFPTVRMKRRMPVWIKRRRYS